MSTKVKNLWQAVRDWYSRFVIKAVFGKERQLDKMICIVEYSLFRETFFLSLAWTCAVVIFILNVKAGITSIEELFLQLAPVCLVYLLLSYSFLGNPGRIEMRNILIRYKKRRGDLEKLVAELQRRTGSGGWIYGMISPMADSYWFSVVHSQLAELRWNANILVDSVRHVSLGELHVDLCRGGRCKNKAEDFIRNLDTSISEAFCREDELKQWVMALEKSLTEARRLDCFRLILEEIYSSRHEPVPTEYERLISRERDVMKDLDRWLSNESKKIDQAIFSYPEKLRSLSEEMAAVIHDRLRFELTNVLKNQTRLFAENPVLEYLSRMVASYPCGGSLNDLQRQLEQTPMDILAWISLSSSLHCN